jgi:hypothetical protein
MTGKIPVDFDPSARPVYSHLEPIVDLLIANGNQLALDYKWGENRTGFYCFMSKALDFDLIENHFSLPNFIRLDRENGVIECDQTWATIRGGMPGSR